MKIASTTILWDEFFSARTTRGHCVSTDLAARQKTVVIRTRLHNREAKSELARTMANSHKATKGARAAILIRTLSLKTRLAKRPHQGHVLYNMQTLRRSDDLSFRNFPLGES